MSMPIGILLQSTSLELAYDDGHRKRLGLILEETV